MLSSIQCSGFYISLTQWNSSSSSPTPTISNSFPLHPSKQHHNPLMQLISTVKDYGGGKKKSHLQSEEEMGFLGYCNISWPTMPLQNRGMSMLNSNSGKTGVINVAVRDVFCHPAEVSDRIHLAWCWRTSFITTPGPCTASASPQLSSLTFANPRG